MLLWLHSGKPAFIGTFMEYPFFLLIKRRKISQGVVAFPPSFICLLIILHICSCLHLFNALTECVCVCVYAAPLNCVCTLSFSGQMHRMHRRDLTFLFIHSHIFTNTLFLTDSTVLKILKLKRAT